MTGFKSFAGESQLIDFSELEYGLHLFKSKNIAEPHLDPNGAGKSSLFDALTWCLYGRTIDDLRNTDVRPWYGKNKTSVTIEAEINGKRYNVTRTISPNRILLNGKDASQEQLNALFPSLELLANTILLGQGQPLFFDIEPRDKMRLFAEAMDLDRWDIRSTRANEKVNKLLATQSEIQTDIVSVGSKIEQNQKSLQNFRTQRDDWDRDQDAKLTTAHKQLSKAREDLERLTKKLDGIEIKQDNADTEIDALDKDIKNRVQVINDLKRQHDKLEFEINTLTRDRSIVDRELKDVNKSDTCPTCGQSLKGPKRDRHIGELESKIADIDKKLIKINTEAITKDIEREEMVLNTLETSRDTFAKSRNQRTSEVEVLRKNSEEVRVKVTSLKTSVAELEQAQNPYTNLVSETRRKLKKQEALLKDYEAEANDIERRIAIEKGWVKGFKDIRLLEIEETLYELQLATNAVLGEIGLVDWSVNFSIERETKSGSVQRGINVMIKSPSNKDLVKWKVWSGGERQRLKIISALALSDVLLSRAGISCDLEIIDEPTSYMAARGVRSVCEFLAWRSKKLKKRIMYVDHHAKESPQIASTITIVRNNSGSKIIQGAIA